jgi:hypothetical protein
VFTPPATKAGSATLGAVRPAPASVRMPLAFMLVGVMALLAGMIWIVAQPTVLSLYHYHQSVIAVTHLVVLGCCCSIAMGAMYQLVPVALETRLFSERLARWHLLLHGIGFLGMVWMFRVWDLKQVGHFASALALGVGLFVFNLGRTLLRVPKWSVTATAVTAALVWLSSTILLGLAIAAGKCTYESTTGLVAAGGVRQLVDGLRSVAGYIGRFDQFGAMHAHAHLGTVGFFLLLIVGVSYRLIPMFTLSAVQSPRRAAASVALLNVGLLGAFLTILLRSPWKLAFAAIIIGAFVIYGVELVAMLRARKRGPLDWGLRMFLTAVGLLIPVCVLALVLSWPGLPLTAWTGQLENLYGFLGLVGVVVFAIYGMLYKIVPFLVWFGVYSPHIGRGQVPALGDLYSVAWQRAGYWTYLGGLLVTSAGILLTSNGLIRGGGALLGFAVAALGVNLILILRHFRRPVLTPLPGAARTSPAP